MIRIEKVDTDEETGSEVIYWATHFPVGFVGMYVNVSGDFTKHVV